MSDLQIIAYSPEISRRHWVSGSNGNQSCRSPRLPGASGCGSQSRQGLDDQGAATQMIMVLDVGHGIEESHTGSGEVQDGCWYNVGHSETKWASGSAPPRNRRLSVDCGISLQFKQSIGFVSRPRGFPVFQLWPVFQFWRVATCRNHCKFSV